MSKKGHLSEEHAEQIAEWLIESDGVTDVTVVWGDGKYVEFEFDAMGLSGTAQIRDIDPDVLKRNHEDAIDIID